MEQRRHYRTLVLSDIHLGTSHSKTDEVSHFLSNVDCDRLILNGDIIDGWQLKKGGTRKWQAKHTRFFKILMRMMERQGTEIIYVRGNHDDFLDNLAPLSFANLHVVKDYELESCGKRYFVTHGDIFDHVTSSMRWLARIGDIGYSLLMWFNRLYNRRRMKRGLPYYSVSQKIKQKVKASVSYISDFEQHLVRVANQKGCTGVICGHIHQADKRMIGDVLYLNSGDWVESMTALAEDYAGNWTILRYDTEKEAH